MSDAILNGVFCGEIYAAVLVERRTAPLEVMA